MHKSRRRSRLPVTLLLVALVAAGLYFGLRLRSRLEPMPPGPSVYIRFERTVTLEVALSRLQAARLIRDADAVRTYTILVRRAHSVPDGTYRLRPGMTAGETLDALVLKITQRVRLPEGWWIARAAKILETKGVSSAAEYVDLANRAELFQNVVDFPLPKRGSLEGYLYPDTYLLPPLLGAREAIIRQLQAFQSKVIGSLPRDFDLRRAVIIGSMVELEVARDDERPIVAGVIENRLRKGMPLQIDATVLYALQEWKVLGPNVVNTVDSPYNTYRRKGLPPGPIGSPSAASILAATKPAKTDAMYYVALPNGSHLFAATYAEHLANIRKRKRLMRLTESETQ